MMQYFYTVIKDFGIWTIMLIVVIACIVWALHWQTTKDADFEHFCDEMRRKGIEVFIDPCPTREQYVKICKEVLEILARSSQNMNVNQWDTVVEKTLKRGFFREGGTIQQLRISPCEENLQHCRFFSASPLAFSFVGLIILRERMQLTHAFPTTFFSHGGFMTRSEQDQAAIKAIILKHMTAKQVWAIRKEYAEREESIAELSMRINVPPVLLWSLLTPLHCKPAQKVRYIRKEMKICDALEQGMTLIQIAESMTVPLEEVKLYTEDRFSPKAYVLRTWYNERSPKKHAETTLMYDADTLPPTSRLGWNANELTALPPDNVGRCPTCGQNVYLPCLACRIRDDVKNHRIVQHAAEYTEEEDAKEKLPDLLFCGCRMFVRLHAGSF